MLMMRQTNPDFHLTVLSFEDSVRIAPLKQNHGSTEGKKENKWKLTRVINQN